MKKVKLCVCRKITVGDFFYVMYVSRILNNNLIIPLNKYYFFMKSNLFLPSLFLSPLFNMLEILAYAPTTLKPKALCVGVYVEAKTNNKTE